MNIIQYEAYVENLLKGVISEQVKIDDARNELKSNYYKVVAPLRQVFDRSELFVDEMQAALNSLTSFNKVVKAARYEVDVQDIYFFLEGIAKLLQTSISEMEVFIDEKHEDVYPGQ